MLVYYARIEKISILKPLKALISRKEYMRKKKAMSAIRYILLILIWCVLLTSCGFGTTSIVTFGPCLELNVKLVDNSGSTDQTLVKKAGEKLTTNWQVQQSYIQGPNVQREQLKQVTMQEKLFGPFPSLATINQFSTLGRQPSRGHLITSSQAITTTQCTPKTYTSVLMIPVNLQPGYYDLYQYGSYTFADGTQGATSGDNAITITK